ncbi:MAG: phosphatidylglycerophosphatase A [Planctomycetota bacterium]
MRRRPLGSPPAGVLVLATTFGLGHLRPAPGTWGSLPPCVVALAMLLAGLGGPMLDGAMLAMLVIFSAGCIAGGEAAEALYGRKDPSEVVADETAGQAIALLLLPASLGADPIRAIAAVAVAFLSFRLLDILKPGPAGAMQQVPGGWGILLDDLVAGLMALGVTQLVVRLVL